MFIIELLDSLGHITTAKVGNENSSKYVPKFILSICDSRIRKTPFTRPIARNLPSGLKSRQVAYVPKFFWIMHSCLLISQRHKVSSFPTDASMPKSGYMQQIIFFCLWEICNDECPVNTGWNFIMYRWWMLEVYFKSWISWSFCSWFIVFEL